jgi:hypothetical protein
MHRASISLHFLTLKMEQIVNPETLVFFNLNQTPSNYPKEDKFSTMNHGESLKFNTLSQYLICIVFPIQQWLRECVSILLYVPSLS